jgi:SAM-dependent methyltransferase
VELMQRDVERAGHAFGSDHPVVRIEQGDMSAVDFGQVDVVTILDALHYVDHDLQQAVLARIRAALPPGGLFLTRVGNAGAGLPYHLSNWVDHAAPSRAAFACHAFTAAPSPNGSSCCAPSALPSNRCR